MEHNNTNSLVKDTDVELYSNLEIVSTKVFPLPGSTFSKNNYQDARIKVQSIAGIESSDKITMYHHVATVRDKKKDTFFVAFKQTMDALLMEQQDPKKFPEWLMKSASKRTELSIYIYQVKVQNGIPLFPSKMPNISTHEDWLKPIDSDIVFNTVAMYLLKSDAISIEMFEAM